MPVMTRDELTLHYTTSGDPAGAPVLLLAPGGMRSTIERWGSVPWNPLERLGEHRCIAMDQRNAGSSRGPILEDHGWHTYLADQLALLDHLGVDRFHVVGMCIGGSFGLRLLRAVPERVRSAVLIQPIGYDRNRAMFHDLFDGWARDIAHEHPEADEARWRAFRAAMYGGDFVFSASQADVAAVEPPLLVLMGNDQYHPAAISRQIVYLAQDARLLEGWKEDRAHTDAVVRAFLSA